jgi:hypothetical protein
LFCWLRLQEMRCPASGASRRQSPRRKDLRTGRPRAAVQRWSWMLRCGPSLLTFVHLAALFRLERRSANFVNFRCGCANGRLGKAAQLEIMT